jgi:hypothetical protein
LESIQYECRRQFDSVRDSGIDSNGRLTFFTRWWNQPELELGKSRNANTVVKFQTPNGSIIEKELVLVLVSLVNSGNDDAFDPEIRAYPLVPKVEESGGMLALTRTASLLPYHFVRTPSNTPDEIELAVSFLKDGLTVVPLLAGESVADHFVFGFALRDAAVRLEEGGLRFL